MPKSGQGKRLLVAPAKRDLLMRGERLIAFIHEKRPTVALAFHEIGVALRELSDERLYRALGYATLVELLEKQSLMSPAFAEKLIAVGERVRAEDAHRWMQDKSIAVAALLTVAGVKSTRANVLRLPTGEKLDLEKATTRDLEEACKRTRQTLQSEQSKRGRTSSAEERALAKAVAAALTKGGAKGASARAIATQPGKTSDLEIRVSFDRIGLLARCLEELTKG